MMQVIKSAKNVQTDGIRSRDCVHDVFLSYGENYRVAICNSIMTNITINSDIFLAILDKKRKSDLF